MVMCVSTSVICEIDWPAFCFAKLVFRSVKPSRATVHRTVMEIEKALWL